VINDASDGTPVLGAYAIRPECRRELRQFASVSTCGRAASEDVVMCCEMPPSGQPRARVKPASRCVTSPPRIRNACFASPFSDICSGNATNACRTQVVQETVDIPSAAEPAQTPGSPGVVVTNPGLLTQFGGPSFTLNRARYTRHRLAGPETQPDAILVLVPGFEGGAGDFKILAENLIPRAFAGGQRIEVWAFDRRGNQLEDLAGADIAEEFLDPQVALDWMFGGELGLTLHPVLASGPNRRAIFYNTQADIPFMSNWTPLTFSRDIDAVVEAARLAARNQNVFLGGHSAGTGFTARYAATDFNLTGVGPADPGYAKLRGLVLLEGTGGSTGGPALTADTLDRIEAKFDGGLFGAVRDNAPRCVDGTTACSINTEAADCLGQVPPKCTPPTTAYSVVPGLLNVRILASSEPVTIQAALDPDGGQSIISADQGAPGNSAVNVVPQLAALTLLPVGTAFGGLGSFVDDDSSIASFAFFVATSVGAPGPTVDGLQTWQDITEGPLPPAVLPDNGPPPTTLPGTVWGQEKENTRFDRLAEAFWKGRTNFVDWYYPNAGLSVTTVAGVCSSGLCTVGNVGAGCSTNANCNQAVSLDSAALSVGRGRRDIENLTQAASVNIPVFAVGASNGLAPVSGAYVPFASSIGTCTAPSCDGTPRIVDASLPNPAFPTFGGVNGGFEVVIAEGFAHVDAVTSEDNADNPITPALADFLLRNAQ
jgi:pimeloyl-ACP methyl ester carboxylesterase